MHDLYSILLSSSHKFYISSVCIPDNPTSSRIRNPYNYEVQGIKVEFSSNVSLIYITYAPFSYLSPICFHSTGVCILQFHKIQFANWSFSQVISLLLPLKCFAKRIQAISINKGELCRLTCSVDLISDPPHLTLIRSAHLCLKCRSARFFRTL